MRIINPVNLFLCKYMTSGILTEKVGVVKAQEAAEGPGLGNAWTLEGSNRKRNPNLEIKSLGSLNNAKNVQLFHDS